MPPDQSRTLAPPEQPIICGYCPKKIVWLPTFIGGHRLCFDHALTPRYLDPQNHGWVLGPHPVPGGTDYVYMPWQHAPHVVRRRTTHIRRLHECSGDTWRAMPS